MVPEVHMMRRSLSLLVALLLVTLSCSGSTENQGALADVPPAETVVSGPDDTGSIDDGVEVLSPLTAVVDSSDEPLASESDAGAARLLPDPERWVVVDDWSSRGATGVGEQARGKSR